MYDVFISYSSRDGVKAQQLAEFLSTTAEFSVFFDRSSIPAGKDWRERLDMELSRSQSVVVLWSPNSVNSKWVLHEASIGLSRGILFPCIIEQGTAIPEQFSRIQTVDLRYSVFAASDTEIDNLLLALGAQVGKSINREGDRLGSKIKQAPPLQQDITLVPEQWLRFNDTKILLFFVHQSQITPLLAAQVLSISKEEAQHYLDRLERFGYVEKSISGTEAVRQELQAMGLLPDKGIEQENNTMDTSNQLYAITVKGQQWLSRSVRNP